MEHSSSRISFTCALEKLASLGEEHLLDRWTTLSSEAKVLLLHQIETLDMGLLKQQRDALKAPPLFEDIPIEPFREYSFCGQSQDYVLGKKRISEGALGCLIVAGGQGTRLKFSGPKGMFPITPIYKKSLFQIFAEKTLAAGKVAGRLLPLAIMTSAVNHIQTMEFFKMNHYFGLYPEQVSFFCQGSLPFLDEEGHLIQEDSGALAEGPDGNGSALRHFFEQGIGDQWIEKGVQHIHFVLIDNPLADPFDAELLGFHLRKDSDVTLKCTFRSDPEEKVGVVVRAQDKTQIVEYGEIPLEERNALDEEGKLKHKCANLSLFCFDLAFVKSLSFQANMPLHFSWKPISESNQRKGWKFERYIFDVLPYAPRVSALVYPREACFAPLKNSSGIDSVATVQAALMNRDRLMYEKVTGKPYGEGPIELTQDYYY